MTNKKPGGAAGKIANADPNVNTIGAALYRLTLDDDYEYVRDSLASGHHTALSHVPDLLTTLIRAARVAIGGSAMTNRQSARLYSMLSESAYLQASGSVLDTQIVILNRGIETSGVAMFGFHREPTELDAGLRNMRHVIWLDSQQGLLDMPADISKLDLLRMSRGFYRGLFATHCAPYAPPSADDWENYVRRTSTRIREGAV